MSIVRNVIYIEDYDWLFMVSAFGVPTILSCIGLYLESYTRESPYICFYDRSFWQPFLLFYLPYIIVILVNFLLLIKSYYFLRDLRQSIIFSERSITFNEKDVKIELEVSKIVVANMILYPCALTLCGILPLIWRIFQWSGIILDFLHYPIFILSDLQGFFNCLIYIYNMRKSKVYEQELLDQWNKSQMLISAFQGTSIFQQEETSDTYSEFEQ